VPARITLDHIAIAVPRLEEAMGAWERVFPASASPPEEVPTEKVRLSFLKIGWTSIELLSATAPDSPVARFLEGGRSGVHHLSFRVEGMDLREWCEELKRRGVEVLGKGPRPGAEGRQVFFIHPRFTAGLLVEFSQRPEEIA